MPAIKLNIIKIPLSEPIPDIKPNFGDLNDLHLDLLENKLKLKKGLPLIPINKSPKPSPSKAQQKIQPKVVKKISQDEDLLRDIGGSDTESKHVKSPDKTVETSNIILEREDRDPSPSSETQSSDVPPNENASENFAEDDIGEDVPQDEQHFEESPDDEVNEGVQDEEQKSDEPQISPEEQEELDREEYVVKLRIIKKAHPEYEFPPYSDHHTDSHTLKKIYRQAYRETTLNDSVDNYEMFLGVAFIGIGMLGVKMGLPFDDFASHQMKNMKKYRKMLFELGEKSYIHFMDDWPVEIRLLATIVIDAGIFWLMKVGVDVMGPGAKDLIALMTKSKLPETPDKKPKMKGPQFKPEDIRSMSKNA